MDQVIGVTHETYCEEYVDNAINNPAFPPCSRCGRKSFSYEICDHADGAQTHFAKLICRECSSRVGHQVQVNCRWIPTPGSNGKIKKAKTIEARSHYREKHGGTMICWLCEIRENQYSAGFDMHHIDWLEEKGSDNANPEEIRPLCKTCHQLLTNLKKNMVGHTRGIVKIDTAVSGVNGSLCSASVECKHGDCKNCESRIEEAC